MSKQAQKAKKRRLARQPNGVPDPRANPQPPPTLNPKDGRGFLEVIEHPLILASLLIVGGIAGVVFFAPLLLVCECCVLLALRGSNILKGRRHLYQVAAYAILFLLTAPFFLAIGVYARKPARDYFHQMATRSMPETNLAKGTAPAQARAVADPIPLPGGIFNHPIFNQKAGNETSNDGAGQAPSDQYPPDSPYAALIRQMREKLIRDAGDAQKVNDDVQWMRQQFELGWTTEPPELAKKHREETEQTARLILAAASNRAAILQLVPHITIDK
jgi:hypothetical protein